MHDIQHPRSLGLITLLSATSLSIVGAAATASAAPGDLVHQITVPVSGVDTYCSVGLAFDGQSLYYDRCGDDNVYRIDPITGALQATFASGIGEYPNAMAYDATRNGLWIGAQGCVFDGMQIWFWDFDDNSVVPQFTIPFALTNPATGEPFVAICFTDGLAFNANDPGDPSDDELWFTDDVNRNVGVFRPDGAFVAGYDATSVDPSLASTSGLAIGGDDLYMANNGGGDVFRADKNSDPLAFVDQFTSGDSRQEDMECDPISFAPIEVMWVRTTPQGGAFPDVVTAYEIEPGTCSLGGGGCPDQDADGVCDNDDACPGTVLPEGVPTLSLGTNRWADIDGDGVFDTNLPNGQGPGGGYTIKDTAGCSCEQIIAELGLGLGHSKYGCSKSAMDDWVSMQ